MVLLFHLSKSSGYFLHHCLFPLSLSHWSRQKQKKNTLPSQTQHTFISFKPDHVRLPASATLCYRNLCLCLWFHWEARDQKRQESEKQSRVDSTSPTNTPLPAQSALPATSFHTGAWASINQSRAQTELKTHKITLFKNFFVILGRQPKEIRAQGVHLLGVRRGSGGLNDSKSSKVIQLDPVEWEEMILIPAIPAWIHFLSYDSDKVGLEASC